MVNVIVRPDVYERDRVAVRGEPFLRVTGRLAKDDGAVNVLADEVRGMNTARQGEEGRGAGKIPRLPPLPFPVPSPLFHSFLSACAPSPQIRRIGDDLAGDGRGRGAMLTPCRAPSRLIVLRIRRVVTRRCMRSHAGPRSAVTRTLTRPRPPVVVSELRAMRVNGAVLSYRLAGDQGTPVVFVHGSYGDLNDWSAQVKAFARTHRVFVYSRRYHPPNPPQDDGQVYSPQLHAEDLAGLLPVLGLAPAHIAVPDTVLRRTPWRGSSRPRPPALSSRAPGLPFLLLRSPRGIVAARFHRVEPRPRSRGVRSARDLVAALRLFVDGDRRGTSTIFPQRRARASSPTCSRCAGNARRSAGIPARA